MVPITPADAIARLVAALEAGPTPGPWTAMAKLQRSREDHGYRLIATCTSPSSEAIYAHTDNMRFENGWQWGDDGPFIAACREGVPALLARVAELEQALREIADEHSENAHAGPVYLRTIARAALAASGTGGEK